MNIEVGQWYRGRGEGFIGQVVSKVFDDSYPFCVVIYLNGEVWDPALFTKDGLYLVNETHELDLVEHLPDCDAPNWKPKKWRRATMQDAVDGKQCRVTLDERTFESNISGFKRDARYLYFYIMYQGQCKYWYDSNCVEVIDD